MYIGQFERLSIQPGLPSNNGNDIASDFHEPRH